MEMNYKVVFMVGQHIAMYRIVLQNFMQENVYERNHKYSFGRKCEVMPSGPWKESYTSVGFRMPYNTDCSYCVRCVQHWMTTSEYRQ
jgi:hypothetical protein